MDKVKMEKIRCHNPSCKKWFNAPVSHGDIKSSLGTTMNSNNSQCPHCGRMTEYSNENNVIAAEEGNHTTA